MFLTPLLHVSKLVGALFQRNLGFDLLKSVHFCLSFAYYFFYFEDFRQPFFGKFTGQKHRFPSPRMQRKNTFYYSNGIARNDTDVSLIHKKISSVVKAIVKLNEVFFAISSNHSKDTIRKPRP